MSERNIAHRGQVCLFQSYIRSKGKTWEFQPLVFRHYAFGHVIHKATRDSRQYIWRIRPSNNNNMMDGQSIRNEIRAFLMIFLSGAFLKRNPVSFFFDKYSEINDRALNVRRYLEDDLMARNFGGGQPKPRIPIINTSVSILSVLFSPLFRTSSTTRFVKNHFAVYTRSARITLQKVSKSSRRFFFDCWPDSRPFPRKNLPRCLKRNFY